MFFLLNAPEVAGLGKIEHIITVTDPTSPFSVLWCVSCCWGFLLLPGFQVGVWVPT